MGKTWRSKYIEKYGIDAIGDIEHISNATGIPQFLLDEIAVRASGAWRNNLASVRLKSGQKNPDTRRFPRSARMSRERWQQSRIYGIIMGNPKQVAKGQPDRDIWELIQQFKSKSEQSNSSR